jgi:hypothetical protein
MVLIIMGVLEKDLFGCFEAAKPPQNPKNRPLCLLREPGQALAFAGEDGQRFNEALWTAASR